MLIESILLIIMKFVLIASLSNKNLHNILKINEKYNYSTLSSIDLKYTEINTYNKAYTKKYTHKKILKKIYIKNYCYTQN